MLKKVFLISYLISSIASESHDIESIKAERQKIILPLSKDLFIKNIILFKSPLIEIEANAISFVKSLSQIKYLHFFPISR